MYVDHVEVERSVTHYIFNIVGLHRMLSQRWWYTGRGRARTKTWMVTFQPWAVLEWKGIQWGLCALRHGIQISMEAILTCHPALSTKWLDWVAKVVWTMTNSHWLRNYHEVDQNSMAPEYDQRNKSPPRGRHRWIQELVRQIWPTLGDKLAITKNSWLISDRCYKFIPNPFYTKQNVCTIWQCPPPPPPA